MTGGGGGEVEVCRCGGEGLVVLMEVGGRGEGGVEMGWRWDDGGSTFEKLTQAWLEVMEGLEVSRKLWEKKRRLERW